ncbi:hypothetical protein ACLOJK_010274, partial [Asimina triloba]
MNKVSFCGICIAILSARKRRPSHSLHELVYNAVVMISLSSPRRQEEHPEFRARTSRTVSVPRP